LIPLPDCGCADNPLPVQLENVARDLSRQAPREQATKGSLLTRFLHANRAPTSLEDAMVTP
jgi:hypothetical protein